MRKFLLVSVLVVLVLVLVGCGNAFENIEKISDETILPNGYSLSKQEESKLKSFAVSKGYLDSNYRAVKEEYTEEDIAEMIQALKDEFGAEAEKYYGEIEITNETTGVTDSSDSARSATGTLLPRLYIGHSDTINLKPEFALLYSAQFGITKNFYSWGIWWAQHINITAAPTFRIKGTIWGDENYMLLKAMPYSYTDDVTNYSGTEYNTTSVSCKGSIEYGWLPSIEVATISAWIEHPWIDGGKQYCSTRFVDETDSLK